MPPNERYPFPKENIMFDLFDAFIAVWQTILTALVHHPWMAAFPLVFLLIDVAIKKHDKHKYPDS